MRHSIYQVDAFTDELFRGNPAAVVPLDAPISETLMQSIAAENNLAETAFFYPKDSDYYIRWFTPTTEVPLCGHATLASAYVIFEFLRPDLSLVNFFCASGVLHVRKTRTQLELDFPRIDVDPISPPKALVTAINHVPESCYLTQKDSNYLIVLETESELRQFAPDIRKLAELEAHGLIATAPADFSDGEGERDDKGKDEGEGEVENDSAYRYDFASRYFAPSMGIDEDPVTGSIHCALTPFWSKRLGRTKLLAKQVSQREGTLRCELSEDRVRIAGGAKLYLKGEIYLD